LRAAPDLADGVLDADALKLLAGLPLLMLENDPVVLVVDVILVVGNDEEIDREAPVGVAVEIVVLQLEVDTEVEPVVVAVVVLETKTASFVDGGPIKSGSPHSPL